MFLKKTQLPGHPHLHATIVEVALQTTDAVVTEMHHAGDQRGIGMAIVKHVVEMLGFTCAARGDYRNAHRISNQPRQRNVLTCARAIGVN